MMNFVCLPDACDLLSRQLHGMSSGSELLKKRIVILEKYALAIHRAEHIRRNIPPGSTGRKGEVLTDKKIINRLQGRLHEQRASPEFLSRTHPRIRDKEIVLDILALPFSQSWVIRLRVVGRSVV